ncbi:MAG: hypothetical protein ACJ72J_05855 [Nitrososphaeraceae archaeon]
MELSKTSGIPSFKATLIKHQYTKTPKSTVMYVRKAGRMMLLDWEVMTWSGFNEKEEGKASFL